MKRTYLWQLVVILAIVATSVFAYDDYYRKPARLEQSRTYTVNKVSHPDAPIYESYA
ncbi:hypothetical protein GCM10027578_22300 [Spirosoma luteolum]